MTEQIASQSLVVQMLRAVRVKHHWSQAEMARQLNVSRRTIQHWECGREPPTYLMAALRELLG